MLLRIYGPLMRRTITLPLDSLILSVERRRKTCVKQSCAFVARIRSGRSVQVESMSEFNEDMQVQEDSNSSESKSGCDIISKSLTEPNNQTKATEEVTEEVKQDKLKKELKFLLRASETQPVHAKVDKDVSPDELKNETCSSHSIGSKLDKKKYPIHEPPTKASQDKSQLTDSKKHQTARKVASIIKNSSDLKLKHNAKESLVRSQKPASMRKETKEKGNIEAPNFAQENQAIKKQRLEGGKARHILNVNIRLTLPHKGRPSLTTSTSSVCSSTMKTRKENRKVYIGKPAAPYVSMAEIMRKFQSNRRQSLLLE